MSNHEIEKYCIGCVYYPANLPSHAYPKEDWLMLQEKTCSFDFCPNDKDCQQTRKTSCSIVDFNNLVDAN